MARILFTWELGLGMGHLLPHRPTVETLLERGHEIYFASRNLTSLGRAFDGLPIRMLQSPYRSSPVSPYYRTTATFPQVMNDSGFDNAKDLSSHANAWWHLISTIDPAIVLCDHSPTALVALRALPQKKINIGGGFTCPPDETPFRVLEPRLRYTPEQLERDEARILANANAAIESLGGAPLERLGQLFGELDDTIIFSFQELDHYEDRVGATYWGPPPLVPGAAPEWPEGDGPKIFGYLRAFPILPTVLDRLNELGHPTLIYPSGIDESLLKRCESATLRFQRDRLDLAHVRREADLAILNANLSTTIAMLMAGIPTLMFPVTLESQMVAARAVMMGAGLMVQGNQPNEVVRQLDRMLESDKYAANARAFADRYADWDCDAFGTRVADRVEELIRDA
ncbi:hypothetical protein Pan216_02440 [Planctomycetes bacterium Pan216]|uniref:MurG-like transferase n=1 Tax=Kolteria novifilia TaxID=2527975 RepID=A0A518AXG8_9BACT|nr:hypothetical protein Pan216_02440 [Planctomycetes bacterium Pan216]